VNSSVGVGPPSGTTSPATNAPTAPLRRRWGALFYEGLLLAALLLVAGFALLPLVGPPAGVAPNAGQLYLLPTETRAFVLVYYAAVSGLYFIAFWTNGRRTLPMKTWHLALVRAGGGSLGARQAIIRYFSAWIGPIIGLALYGAFGRWGFLAGLANYAWAWVDRDRQFLHDRIAGTRIVRG